MSLFPENDYTDDGQFLGHIVIGVEMVGEITRNLSESTATSVDAYMATWITLAILAFLLIVVPLFERVPMLKDCISRRWVIVTITTTLMLSVVINFQHLNDSVREAIIIGGFIVGIAYIFIRSIEKWLANGWSFGVKRIMRATGIISTAATTMWWTARRVSLLTSHRSASLCCAIITTA